MAFLENVVPVSMKHDGECSTRVLACENAHLYVWGFALVSPRLVSTFSSAAKILTRNPQKVSLLAGYEGLSGVNRQKFQ